MPEISKGFNSIQMLRAMAAILVVLAHSQVHIYVRGHIRQQSDILHFGTSGVDIFFVISGFIMAYISYNAFNTRGASADFLVRRIIRIVPVYWFYTLVITSLLILMPGMFSEGKSFNFVHFIASLVFIPWESAIGQYKPVLGVGWTLNFEMYFYLIFSLLLLLNRRWFLLLIGVLLLGSVFTGTFIDVKGPVIKQVTSPLLIEFFMGCILGVMIREGKYTNVNLAVVMLIIGLLGYVISLSGITTSMHRAVKWGIPSALIVYSLVVLEVSGKMKFRNKVMLSIGNSSYSLYLTHIFTINLVGFVWYRIIGGMNGLFIIMASVASLIAGYIAYHVIERPITQKLRAAHKSMKSR